jgi:branched-chain amino acid transport system ATP-binding protein
MSPDGLLPPALRLTGITAGYGELPVLRAVDLALPAGGAGALLGPNGAGKTTALRVASGILAPAGGSVWIGDTDATDLPPHERQRLGMCHVPEGRGVFPSLTVRENLRLQTPAGDEAGAAERAVEAFPSLGRRIGNLAGTLSGGEQQMLAVARAYVSSPRLVLLDEVSLGLAPKVVDEIYAFLDRLRDEGTALLLVEQFVDRALALADNVWVLVRGQVVLSGRPDDLDRDEIAATYLGTPVG